MADKSNQPLFSEFAPVSTQEWMDKITADLKGADFDKKLVWRTNEGFNVRPFTGRKTLKTLSILTRFRANILSFAGQKPTISGWFVRILW